MRGFGRVVAGVILAGAVAGAAAFAHLLGSVPAPSSSVAALPPAPVSPLIVQAAPWIPARSGLGVAIRRPKATPVAGVLIGPVRPLVRPLPHLKPSAAPVKSIAPVVPSEPRVRVAPEPVAAQPAPVAAAAPAAAPVAAPAAVAAAPAAAAATHTLAGLALTKAVPVVVTAVPKTTEDKNQTGRFKHVSNERHDRNGSQKGNDGSSPTVLATVAVPAPQPVASPQPVVAIPLPSVSPPSPVVIWHVGDEDQGTSWHGHGTSDHFGDSGASDSH